MKIYDDAFGWFGALVIGLFLLFCCLWGAGIVHAGKGVGEDAAYAREVGFETIFFYKSGGNGDGQIEYICRAFPGTIGSDDTADDVWQVQRFTYDSSDRVSTMAFAGDDDAFTQ